MSYLAGLGVVAHYVNTHGIDEASLHALYTSGRMFVSERDRAGFEQNALLLRTMFEADVRRLLQLYVAPAHGALVTAALRALCPAWRCGEEASPPRPARRVALDGDGELRRLFACHAGAGAAGP